MPGLFDRLLDFTPGRDDISEPRRRARDAIAAVRNQIRRWPAGRRGISAAVPVFGEPGKSVLSQVQELWPGKSRPNWATIVSPFFDKPPDDKKAAGAMVELFSRRWVAKVHLGVSFEDLPDKRRRLFVGKGLVGEFAASSETYVWPILQEQEGERRPLHAKEIYLAGKDWVLLLVGSSNFTEAGLGVVLAKANFEANIVYRARSDDKSARILDHVFPEMEEDPVNLKSKKIVWEPVAEEEGEGSDKKPLPVGFEEAIYVAGDRPSILIRLGPSLPKNWSIRVPPDEILVSSDGWKAGRDEYRIDWRGPSPPFLLEVRWSVGESKFIASWPVNIEDPSTLPPPEVLRNISLEEFIEILGSTRPLHNAVAAVIAKRGRRRIKNLELDPHKRVETGEFLLRRTHRVALALDRLRERLEHPVLTRDALQWRLSGPLGPTTLADLFVREAKHPAEAAFFLAELVLSLGRVDAKRITEGGIGKRDVRELILECIHFVREKSRQIVNKEVPSDIRNYSRGAFREAVR